MDETLYIAFANTNLINYANRLPKLASQLKQFHILNDGLGIQVASLLTYGKRFPKNLNGMDLVPRLLNSFDRKVRLYLLGADSETVQVAANSFKRIKNVEIYGFWDGYSCWGDMPRVLQNITEARPDILLVAMGNPRQEMWIAQFGLKVKANILVGVGALFDYISGRKQRAPLLCRWLRMEWLFRLLFYEPRRLWRRYSVELAMFWLYITRSFITRVAMHRLVTHSRASRAFSPSSPSALDSQLKCDTEVCSERLDRGAVAEALARR
jgi:beta-1,4-glucosyltransferase